MFSCAVPDARVKKDGPCDHRAQHIAWIKTRIPRDQPISLMHTTYLASMATTSRIYGNLKLHNNRDWVRLAARWDRWCWRGCGKSGAADASDGQNIVLHEFAHQLDYENFAPMERQPWRRVKINWHGGSNAN